MNAPIGPAEEFM